MATHCFNHCITSYHEICKSSTAGYLHSTGGKHTPYTKHWTWYFIKQSICKATQHHAFPGGRSWNFWLPNSVRKTKGKDTMWGVINRGKIRERWGSLWRFSHLVAVNKTSHQEDFCRRSTANVPKSAEAFYHHNQAQAHNLPQEMGASRQSAQSWKTGSRRDNTNICLVDQRICFSPSLSTRRCTAAIKPGYLLSLHLKVLAWRRVGHSKKHGIVKWILIMLP